MAWLKAGCVALLVLLPVLPAGAVFDLTQNDAGSGMDAPDRFEDALIIGPGQFEGELVAVLGVEPADNVDWYRIWLPAGTKVTASMEMSGDPTPPPLPIHEIIVGYIAGPDGVPVSMAFSSPAEVVTDQEGWWGVQVSSALGLNVAYRVSVDLAPGEIPDHVMRGQGILGFQVSVPDGEIATLAFQQVGMGNGVEGWLANLQSIALGEAAAGGPDRLEVAATYTCCGTVRGTMVGHEVSPPLVYDIMPEGASAVSSKGTFPLVGPGVYRVTFSTWAEMAYRSIELDLQGATLERVVKGGPELQVLADWGSGHAVGASTWMGAAQTPRNVTVDVEGDLSALALCPFTVRIDADGQGTACSVAADGETLATFNEGAAILGPPATYTHHSPAAFAAKGNLLMLGHVWPV